MSAAAAVRYRIKGTGVYVNPVRRSRASTANAYDGASTAPRLANWNISSTGPNASIGSSLSTLRSRSRDVARKNGLADGGLEILVSNFVGTGIKPQFNTPDAALNKALADAWLTWTDFADADGAFDFYGLQALAVRSMLEAGDVFGRLRTRRLGDIPTVPLQIQLLESEFCPVEKSEALSNGLAIIHQGIEFDAIGRRTAYWLYRNHPQDFAPRGNNSFLPVRVPASEIVHLKQSRRPGMIRGEPWLSRALIKLYELDQYDDAQLVRQKLAAMFAGFMTPSADGKFGYQEDADSEGISLAALEPGTMQVLKPGATMNFTSPPSPGDSYESFMGQQHRYIAGSLGILYEQLTGDFRGVNDRTWRAAMNEFKRRIERLQFSTLVFQFCRPIMERWADYAVMAGIVKLPAGITVQQVARPRWVPQAWAYINPVQDIEAQRNAIRAGFKSRAQTVSETGLDVEQVDKEISTDNNRADGLELRFDSDGRTDLKGGLPSEEPEVDPNAPPADDAEDKAATAAMTKQLFSTITQSLAP